MNPSDPKPETSPGMKVLKVILIFIAVAITLPVLGLLLLLGVCAMNGKL